MTSLIRLPNANFTALTNAAVIPRISSFNGLNGAYWLASGDENARLRNHAAEAGPSLIKTGTPTVSQTGLTVVGGGNGFDTQLKETPSLTYIGVFARADVTTAPNSAHGFTAIGNYNDDPVTNDYSARLSFGDSDAASNNVATWRGGFHYNANGVFTLLSQNPTGNSNTSPFARTFANGIQYHFVSFSIDAATETAALYIPKIQQAPALSNPFTGTNRLSTRRLFKDDGTTPIPIGLGLVDDATKGNFNGALAFAMIYDRALSAAEIMAQYTATKAQMQALYPSDIRFSSL